MYRDYIVLYPAIPTPSFNVVFKRFSSENVLVYSSDMQFVNKDNVYLKICFDVFNNVSSR